MRILILNYQVMDIMQFFDILPTIIYSFNDINEVLIFENCRSEFEKI